MLFNYVVSTTLPTVDAEHIARSDTTMSVEFETRTRI